MVNEEKVKLMTKLAIYEKKEGKRNLMISKFYRRDYVRYNVLKTLVAATVVYWAVIAAYVFIKFDDILAKINEIDYFDLMYKMLGGYVAFCLVYFFVGEMVYSYRFHKAKPGLIKYNVNLKKLIELEGGKKKRKKKQHKVVGQVVSTEDELEFEQPEQSGSNVRIRRSDMVNQRIAEEEQIRQQQIIENANRMKARMAAKEEERLLRERQMEEEQLRKRQQQRLRYEQAQRAKQQQAAQQLFNQEDSNQGRSEN